eukprot:5701237-Prymnesium_polylepis.1
MSVFCDVGARRTDNVMHRTARMRCPASAGWADCHCVLARLWYRPLAQRMHSGPRTERSECRV